MVEEGGGDAEFPGQLRGEGTDAEGLGGVVAAVEGVEAGFLREGIGPVWTFPGDEGVDSLGGRFLELGSGASGAYPDALASIGATREEAGRGAECRGEAGGQFKARDGFGELDLDADMLVMVSEEGAPPAESEGLGESGCVSESGMGVEGQMLGVDGEIVLDEAADEFGARAGPGRGLSPEQAVVDDEQVATGLDSQPGDGERAIHGGADLADLAAVLELEPVLGAVPVAEAGRGQQRVGEGNDLGEGDGGGGHGVERAVGLFRAQDSRGWVRRPSFWAAIRTRKRGLLER